MKQTGSQVHRAIEAIRRGEMVIVVDDADRENEGDFVLAAESITAEQVNFLVTHGRGLVCVPLTRGRAADLQLELMVNQNTARLSTQFTISVDALHGTSTGISAADRAITIRTLSDPATRPEILGRPGHIFPLLAHEQGLLGRPGHTEAAVDLCRLAGRQPVGVVCEIMAEDGSMAHGERLREIASTHNMPLVTIRELIAHLRAGQGLVHRTASVRFPTKWGNFTLHVYHSDQDGKDHLAITKGDLLSVDAPLVRVHSSCLTGDLFGSCRCDCGDQLHAALTLIETTGVGAVIYMLQEGRGIGLANKILAYKLQDEGRDTVEANQDLGFEADLRSYEISAAILRDLGLSQVRLLTNNPAKVNGLTESGITVVERVPLQAEVTPYNAHYLDVKREKLGHKL